MIAECGGFWFWFMRPAAELFGTLAIIAAFGLPIGAAVWFLNWQAGRGKKKAT